MSVREFNAGNYKLIIRGENKNLSLILLRGKSSGSRKKSDVRCEMGINANETKVCHRSAHLFRLFLEGTAISTRVPIRIVTMRISFASTMSARRFIILILNC